MENPEAGKPNFNSQTRERTFRMATRIGMNLRDKKAAAVFKPAVLQIMRSSSSVAANYCAATRARSDAEFYAKICIVVEECDETLFWLEYLTAVDVLDATQSESLLSEVEQLTKLFNAIKAKMKVKVMK